MPSVRKGPSGLDKSTLATSSPHLSALCAKTGPLPIVLCTIKKPSYNRPLVRNELSSHRPLHEKRSPLVALSVKSASIIIVQITAGWPKSHAQRQEPIGERERVFLWDALEEFVTYLDSMSIKIREVLGKILKTAPAPDPPFLSLPLNPP